MTEPGLRPARTADLPGLTRMRAALCAEDGPTPFAEEPTVRAFTLLLEQPEAGEVWVAVDPSGSAGEDPIAYLVLTWGFSLEFRGRDAFVDELYVVPSARGRGLGTRLLERAEARCRNRGVAALHLEVERGNRRAQELYRRRGFRDHDRYLMTKDL